MDYLTIWIDIKSDQ